MVQERMSSSDKMYFSTVKLLSQYLADIEPLYNETACLGSDERMIIGLLEGIQVFDEIKNDPELVQQIKQIKLFFTKLGIANWIRFELTDLGLRVGSKHEEVSEAVVDESDVYQAPDKE
jgi:hypothetical protein